MALLARAATVLAGIALIAGPVVYLRARQPSVAPTQLPVAAELLPTAEPPVPDSSIRITDELVRAQEIRSATPPAQTATSLRVRRVSRARLQRGSVLARLFLGNGDYRPRPFPRPRS